MTLPEGFPKWIDPRYVGLARDVLADEPERRRTTENMLALAEEFEAVTIDFLTDLAVKDEVEGAGDDDD